MSFSREMVGLGFGVVVVIIYTVIYPDTLSFIRVLLILAFLMFMMKWLGGD